MPPTIIFDFDGTLVDSRDTIYKAFETITLNIAPERINYAKNILIGPPLRTTAKEILGNQKSHLLDEFVKMFIKIHDDEVILNTKIYPFVNDMLNMLYSQGIKMAIATNKRMAPTMSIINYFNWRKFFISIECTDSKKRIRKKLEMIEDILKKDKDFHDGYFMGDTVDDGLSANGCSLKFIKANYGYGTKQDWSNVKVYQNIDSVRQINL